MAQIKKTNNSYLGNKIDLRLNHLPKGDLSVLDCYGGAGLIWRAIMGETKRRIRYVAIDESDYSVGFYLPGNNLAYLQSLDLGRFNVIDLDAYGVPFEQLEILFQRGYTGRVFVTFIQIVVGAVPYRMLTSVGFSTEMIRKTPALFFKRGWEYFLEYLAQKGVRTVTHRSHARKHYLVFDINATGQPAEGYGSQPGDSPASPS